MATFYAGFFVYLKVTTKGLSRVVELNATGRLEVKNIHPILGPQKCFIDEFGFRKCNWKHINGIPTATKSGKWWTWYVGCKVRKQKETADQG